MILTSQLVTCRPPALVTSSAGRGAVFVCTRRRRISLADRTGSSSRAGVGTVRPEAAADDDVGTADSSGTTESFDELCSAATAGAAEVPVTDALVAVLLDAPALDGEGAVGDDASDGDDVGALVDDKDGTLTV